MTSSASRIVFIDRAVAGHAALAAALPAGFEAVFIDTDRDGLVQVADLLEHRADIASVSIVSHGTAGVLALGSTQLSAANLDAYAPQLATLRHALAPGADLLLYGCDVAATAGGQALVDALAAATGADVAASADTSGAAALGGNWDLERQTGTIAAASLLPDAALASLSTTLDFSAPRSYAPAPSPIPEFTTTGWLYSVTGDFDGDGDLDMMYDGAVDGKLQMFFYENKGGILTPSTTMGTPSVPNPTNINISISRLVDFDGDGDLDLYFGVNSDDPDIYLVNNGKGVFSQAASPLPKADPVMGAIMTLVGDFDNDGDMDVLRQDAVGAAPVFYENVDGALGVSTKVVVPAVPRLSFYGGAMAADFDGDGDLDIYMAVQGYKQNGTNDIYLRNDGGIFSEAPIPAPEAINVAFYPSITGDFDSDGDLDMIKQEGVNLVYLKNTNGVLAVSTDIVMPSAQGLSIGYARAGDYDNDGDLDIYIPVYGANNDFYFQMPGTGPLLTGSSPADASGAIAPDANIVLRFNKTVVAMGGNIYIHDAADGSIVATISSTGTQVSGSGTSTITIDPAQALAVDHTFYLTFDTHTFVDGDGMLFGKFDKHNVLVGQDDPYLVRFTAFVPNDVPTLGTMDKLTGGVEDNVRPVSFADLAAAGNALDTDGSVAAFVVKAVSSGTLRIGLDAASATPWAAGSNDVVDATHLAFWTPAANANGAGLDAFTVVARDDRHADSAVPVQVRIDVAAVNDTPTLAHGASLPTLQEDPAANPGARVADLLAASGYADADGDAAAGIAIAAAGADPVHEGHWEYATDPSGQDWQAVGAVTPAAALLLPAGAWLRFVPVADYAGTPGTLTVHAVDAAYQGSWSGTMDVSALGAAAHASAGAAWSIAVAAVNDKPVIGNLGHGDDRTVNVSDGAVAIDLGANATIADVDNASFAGGRLAAAIAAGGDAADVLDVRTDARVTLANGIVSIDGVAIGTRALVPGLAFDLNADATAARVATLLQHITFDTVGTVAGPRTVQVTLADGAGATSDVAETTITVVRNPTLAISSTAATLKAGETATLTLTFSSAPQGFALADLDVTGGTVTDLQPTADPRTFNATFTPAATQALAASISIAAGAFTDADGLGNMAASALVAFGGDTLAPAVTGITVLGAPAADATTVQFQVKLSEAVTGLDAADFTLAAGGATTATIGNVSGAGDTYTVTVKDIAGNGSLRLDLKGSATGIADAAGNAAGAYANGAVHTVSFNAVPVIVSNAGMEQATVKMAEGRTAVATVQASDADHDALAYAIDGGTDADLFTIDAVTGALAFKHAPAWSSAPNAVNSYQVRVGVTDGHGGSDSQLLTVQVLSDIDRDGIPDVDDDDIDNDGLPNTIDGAVPDAHGNGHGDGNGDGIPDSQQINVASLPTAAPGNPYATLAVADGYTLGSLGTSPAPASGLPRGVKLPLGVLDFTIGNVAQGGTVEMAIYVDASLKVNAYYKQDINGAWKNIAKSVTTVGTKTKITFDLTDGGLFDNDHQANGSIQDPGGVAFVTPQITSNGGEATAAVQVKENMAAVTTVTASAIGAVSYAITGGADAALFKIDAVTGALRFVDAPDFESPRDQGDGVGNNTYVVQVQALDANGSETQTLTVRVTDVDETVPTQETTVDGVKVVATTQQNPDGS
ncbi:DUF4347 domain-containing protein, partial [uncultured Massilia sp.]|uniref:DUF4347 domain-containing protein n=1 Tax=uncultured Massilia sp. TaxID=169973 RepID=UPI0025D0A490